VGLGSQDALNPWILLLLAAPPPGCSSSWLLLLPAATHNNFSFNFSILSVIYTCHAMAVKLCPDPRCRDSPSGRSVSLVFCFFFWFFLSACRTAAFVFATAIAFDYTLLINGRVRLKQASCPCQSNQTAGIKTIIESFMLERQPGNCACSSPGLHVCNTSPYETFTVS